MDDLLQKFFLTLQVHKRWDWLKKFAGDDSVQFYQEELEHILGPAGEHSFIALYAENREQGVHKMLETRRYFWKYKYEDKP